MHKNNTLYSHEEGALTCLHITKCMQNLTSETCQNEDVAEFTASCSTLLFKRYRHRFTSLLHHQKHGFKEVHSFFLRKITSEDKPNHLMDLEEAFLSLKEKTKQDFSVLSRVQTFRHFLKDEVSPQNDTFGKRKKKNLK